MLNQKRSVRETSKVRLNGVDIEKIEGLEKASIFITKLWLNSNKIVKIEGLNKCKNLVVLNLSKN